LENFTAGFSKAWKIPPAFFQALENRIASPRLKGYKVPRAKTNRQET
jgi:hypothetical protein